MGRRSSDERAATLRQITDLFLHTAPRLDRDTSGVFDDVMGRLIEAIESGARAELGERLAPLPNAPVNVIRRLARDHEIAVAGAVLRHSPRLTSSDLVEIAEHKSQAHLLAISDRSRLEQVVTDVLVDRGNDQVVSRVLSNPGASFSERGLGTAIRRAEDNLDLADLLAHRSDIPAHVLCSLLVRASAEVRQRLMAEAPPELRAAISNAVAKISDKLAVGAGEEKHDFAGAVRRLLLAFRGKQICESDILDLARNRQFADAVAAVSLYCKIPIDAIARMIGSGDLHPILILGKAAGFDWPTIRALIILGPRHSPEALTEACSDFNKLSVASAQATLKFWQGQATAR
jgi:hypothetical protein